MPTIRVETAIAAPPERCFDLARDIRIHEQTTARTRERVISVIRGGGAVEANLLEQGDLVTFEAVHLGVRQRLVSKIVAFEKPIEFTDEMQKGAFKKLRHVHRFEAVPCGTKMVDILDFESPGWVVGHLVNKIFLVRYMRRFIENRGLELKRLAEN